MIRLRPAEERGWANHGWLDTRHTFSFAHYYDPAHMGFRSLRVINEDWIQPGTGFDTHGHRDMEVISFPVSGSLAHRDSTGAVSVIHPGSVQRMSAGRGIRHSEYNASETDAAHFLQIWILPQREGLVPGYEQRDFAPGAWRGTFGLVASPDGAQGSLTVHQDVRLYVLQLEADRETSYDLSPGRHAWVQMVSGRILLNGSALKSGDGAACSQEGELRLRGLDAAQLLLFDLA
ncbi:MAG: pirin family protein [Magnetococcales bacterium]|nr:pirin family protein [Magnetococcales bacterium]